MKYLKEFLNLNEYETYEDGEDFVLPNVSLVNNPLSVKFTPYIPPNYFRITNLYNDTADVQFLANWSSSYPQDEFFPITIEYSINGNGIWTSVSDDKEFHIIIPANGYVELRGDNISMCDHKDSGGILYWNLTVSEEHILSGDIMSISSFSKILADHHFYRFFENNTNLIDASNLILSAEELTSYCYYCMFEDCTNLTTAPELPATTLADYCYHYMFNNCASLTIAPELPATTLANSCYSEMFQNCTSLTTAPELPAITLTPYCYYYMFAHCTSLTTAPELPATTLTDYCYHRMFLSCTSLVNVPDLHATTLANGCCGEMFSHCTSLTRAPELPATTLTSSCYGSMFYNCTSLNYIKAMFTTMPSTTYTDYWVANVASTGTFVKNAAATWTVTGIHGIPEGWTVQTAIE